MYDKLAEMLEQGHYEDALAELGQIDIDDYTEELGHSRRIHASGAGRV